MADEPIFYRRNPVDASAEIVVSSGSAVKDRVRDRDYSLQWQTSGEDDDTDLATIEVFFKDNGQIVNRNVDTLFVQNTNLKQVYMDFWDISGSVWTNYDGGSQIPSGAFSNNNIFATKANGYMSGAVPANGGIRLRMQTTQTPDQEKKIGEMWVLETLWTATKGFFNHTNSEGIVKVYVNTIDGGIHNSLIKWAGNRVSRWGAGLSFSAITGAELEILKSIFYEGDIVIYPEPIKFINNIYAVSIIENSLNFEYLSKYKNAGHNLEFSVTEN